MTQQSITVNNNNLKAIFAETWQDMMTNRVGPLPTLKKFSAQTGSPTRGGKVYEFSLVSSYGAAVGGPNGTSLTHFGNENPDQNLVGMTSTIVWSRAAQDYERKILFAASGLKGSFGDEAARKLMGCLDSYIIAMNGQLAQYGNAVVTTIATATAAITAGSTSGAYEVQVSRGQFVQPDDCYQVYSANGNIVSGVVLTVLRKKPSIEQTGITVRNDGGSPYTPAAGDQLVYAYQRGQTTLNGSDARWFLTGYLAAINDGVYPPVEGNNIQPTNNGDYIAYTNSAQSGVSILDTCWALSQQVRLQKPRKDLEMLPNGNGSVNTASPSEVLLIHPYHYNSIRTALETGIRYTNGMPPSTDSVWGPITQLGDVQFAVSELHPLDSILYVNGKGWALNIPGAERRTTQQGPWQPIAGTTTDEMCTATVTVAVCLDRKSQGIITGVSGSPLVGVAPTS